MKAVWLAVVIPALCLGACNRPREAPAAADAAVDLNQGLRKPSRYEGIGIYHPGEMWSQIAVAEPSKATPPPGADAPKPSAAATLKDDDEVIVVVDNRTGELRQCGNLSGVCVSMNPWAKPLAASQNAPLTLTKHAEELEAEAAAKAKAETEASNRALARAEAVAKRQAEAKAHGAEPVDTQ